jgi:tRNA threonylcarbamoyladenosine biosynthesis protein TsaB
MLVMGIETSGNLCSVAFCKGEMVVAEYSHEIPMKHTELVGTLIQNGLDFIEKEVAGSEKVDLVAVSIGPGSFTGLRIGLSYAQGFCFGRNIPIVGISNQQVLAAQSVSLSKTVYSAIDARRNEFFIAENRKSSDKLSEIVKHDIVKIEDFNNYFPENAEIIFMKGANIEQSVKESLQNRGCLLHYGNFSASVVAKIGLEKFETVGSDDADTIEPLYVRPFAGVK